MQASELTLFCLVSVLFLLVGFVIGWLIRENIIFNVQRVSSGPLHPEFFNEDGSINADEVVSLRIEPGFMSEFADDYHSLFEEDEDEDD
jgi:hypothetical protein